MVVATLVTMRAMCILEPSEKSKTLSQIEELLDETLHNTECEMPDMGPLQDEECKEEVVEFIEEPEQKPQMSMGEFQEIKQKQRQFE